MVLLLSGSASNPPATALWFAAAAVPPFLCSTVQSSVCVNNISHFCLMVWRFFLLCYFPSATMDLYLSYIHIRKGCSYPAKLII